MPPLGHRKTHCIRGHEKTEANTDSRTHGCIICINAKRKEWLENNKDYASTYFKERIQTDPTRKQKRLEYVTLWAKTNKDKRKATTHKRSQKVMATLPDSYMEATVFRVPRGTLPPELLEYRRSIILLKREIKNAVT